MSPRDARLDSARLAALPPLPRDEDGPVFAEPWQAQAFALAVKLSEQKYFTWKEWTTALADELKTSSTRDEPDDGSRYYPPLGGRAGAARDGEGADRFCGAPRAQGSLGGRLPAHATRAARPAASVGMTL